MEERKFTAKHLVCVECGQEFTFSTGEQEFFHSKRLSEPKRCEPCRRLRKERLVPEVARND